MNDNKHLQSIIILNAFSTPKTMLMVSKETGIERANICRYVSAMQDSHKIKIVGRGKDPYSGFKAKFYLRDDAQLSIFFNDIHGLHKVSELINTSEGGKQ